MHVKRDLAVSIRFFFVWKKKTFIDFGNSFCALDHFRLKVSPYLLLWYQIYLKWSIFQQMISLLRSPQKRPRVSVRLHSF